MDDLQRFDRLDLNLFRLLQAIVATGSTKAAAEKLGISQASASRGLAQLKELFGEQLFIRKAHGVEASELAVLLAEAAGRMMDPIEEALVSFFEFKPDELRQGIVIIMDPYLLEEQGGRLLQHLLGTFPKANFALSAWDTTSEEQMLAGRIDYCICDQETMLPQTVFSQTLYSEPMLILARNEHPLLCHPYTWKELATLPVVLLPAPLELGRSHYVEKEYRKQGYLPNVLLSSTSLAVALSLLPQNDAIMFATASTAALHPEIACYPLPPASEAFSRVTVSGGFLQRRRNNPMFQFLHQTIQGLFSQKAKA